MKAFHAWVLVAALAVNSSAYAFADDEARQAILDLRKEVRALKDQLDVQSRAQMQLVTQLNRLTEQNRVLTGRLEEISNTVNVEQRSSRELYTKLDGRLMALEPTTMEIDGKTVEIDPQEKADFDAALSKLREGSYKEAASGFQRFVNRWERSPLKAEALFWWGSSAFAQGQYKTTMNIQNRLLRECPKSGRAADAMLSVGSSQAALGNVRAAVSTFEKVIKTYPKEEAADVARSRLADMKKASGK